MMVMTAKVDKKKIIMVLAGVAVAVILLFMLFGGNDDNPDPAVQTATGNDARVAFLKEFGWEVNASPAESGQVRIPENPTRAYERYNALQKSQGYDLSQYAGQTVMRYVYKVTNYPGATEPVYATLLVRQNQVIGGDITNTAAKGAIHGFKKPQMPQNSQPNVTATESSGATEPGKTTEPKETQPEATQSPTAPTQP